MAEKGVEEQVLAMERLQYMLCINIFIRRNKLMKYVCDVCGWEYDEEEGYPEGGIAPGTKWEDVPEDFECPLCNVGKDQFSEVE